MNAARALEIEGEFHKEISGRFYSDPAMYESGKDRLAYEAVTAIKQYRRYLLLEEVRQRKELEDDHYICDACGAHLDRDEKCGCKKNSA